MFSRCRGTRTRLSQRIRCGTRGTSLRPWSFQGPPVPKELEQLWLTFKDQQKAVSILSPAAFDPQPDSHSQRNPFSSSLVLEECCGLKRNRLLSNALLNREASLQNSRRLNGHTYSLLASSGLGPSCELTFFLFGGRCRRGRALRAAAASQGKASSSTRQSTPSPTSARSCRRPRSACRTPTTRTPHWT